MKKAKLTLGLVGSLIAVLGLTACNEVTASDGVVLTFKDASGSRISYTTKELFGEYQKNSGVASTDFDHIQEVLIRKFYASKGQESVLASLKLEAENDVLGIKKTADSNHRANKTSYAAEFEKLLKTNGAKNIDELYEIKLYEREKSKFLSDYESDEQVMFMRDGKNSEGKDMFPYSQDYGRGSDGYLKEQMPYTVRHILVKLTQATNGDHTQAKITEAESKKLGSVVMQIAGATTKERKAFGDIAFSESEDPGSRSQWGRLEVMDRDQADNFIQEFRFGVYAYDAIYNKVNQNAATNEYAQHKFAVPDGSGDTYRVIDSISYSDGATYTDFSKEQTADEKAALEDGEHYIKNYFGSDFKNIGVIPYGAAVALADEKIAKKPTLNFRVNDDSETFYPRNIIFNKYFNDHRVAVVIPTRVPSDDALDGKTTALADTTALSSTAYSKEAELKLLKGVKDDDYAALPGFAKDTSSVLDVKDANGTALNCLTTEKGQIVLAVRGGSSGSYEGIHFIVIDRSALEQYADANSNEVTKLISEEAYTAAKNSSNVNSLSEYYTIFIEGEEGYPTYSTGAAGGAETAKSTYVNPYVSSVKDPYQEKADKIRSKVSSYNSSKDTFIFQQLIEDDETISFAANEEAQEVKKLVLTWIRSKRNSGAIKGRENFDDSWATYVEYLTQQDQSREMNDAGTQRLISETCALGYGDDNSKDKLGEWAVGGACYAK